MKQPKLPSLFKELVDMPVSRLVDQAQEQGRRALAYTCSYMPEALLNVEGLCGVRVRAPGVVGTPMADTYLSSVICSYTRSLLELTLEGTFDSLDGWVFVASCDHMRRLYDNMDYLLKPEFIHILDVPHKSGEAAEKWMTEELTELAEKLSDAFGVDTGPEAVNRAVALQNRYLDVMRELSEMRKEKNPPISGAAFSTLMTTSLASPKDLVIEPLEELAAQLRKAPGIDDHRARLVLAGSQCDDPYYVGVIEDTGGLVVADRTCTGSVPALAPIPVDEKNPLAALAKRSLSNVSCPRMMEDFKARVSEVLDVVKEYQADGVVLQTLKFCDTWGVEAAPMLSAIREAGVPVLRLEREYALTSQGQLQTRIQAFLESMGK
ncbi:MAG: 2-hydroxyacyl-CoA dehydratase family protein [Proteobacteria bacterium]|nr:2-hydroxyacyl-CoA dehydratase family protein [Pseudomonadota bacterium]